MYVIKRDKSEQVFDATKIYNAISKANASVPEGSRIKETTIRIIVDTITKQCEELGRAVDIEFLQDRVEEELIDRRAKAVAKAYITYRYEHQLIRDKYKSLMDKVGDKIFSKDVKNQNANVDERSFGGRKGEATDVLMRTYAEDYLMSDLARERHKNNQIYIHDENAYATGEHNCLTIPYDHLLKNGFTTRQTDVRGARSVNTACQLVAVIAQLQSLQQFGGVSSGHFDWSLVPYVRISFFKHYKEGLKYIREMSDEAIEYELSSYDIPLTDTTSIDAPGYKVYSDVYKYAMEMTEKECRQGVEGLYHNLNTLQSRSGNQLPFTSINYGTCTLPEGRMVVKHLLEVLIEGLGKHHRTSVFPCGIFQAKKGINRKPGDPNYDLFRLALKATALRLYPNYCNCDWSVQQNCVKLDREAKQRVLDSLTAEEYHALEEHLEDDVQQCALLGLTFYKGRIVVNPTETPLEMNGTMGCRTWNGFDVNFEQDYKENIAKVIKGERLPDYTQTSGIQKDGRGNICPVTIILPTVAMEADRDVEKFMKLLDTRIHESKDILLERYEHMCSQSWQSARFMYENNTMVGYKPEEGIRSALRHGTLVIGKIGLAETLQLLLGCDHTDPKGMELAKRIQQLYKDRCNEFKKECHLNFGVYETPSENLCYTSLLKFRDKYGVIPNVSDRTFFTNSSHVPVWKEMNPFEKIDIESQLSGYTSAGSICYVEETSACKHNIDALEELVNYAMDKDIPYFGVNLPNDQCMDCGYLDEFNDRCPECGSENIMQLRRVTGYTTSNYKTAFNPGKIDETDHRVKHR